MSAIAREISESNSPKPNRLTAVPCREVPRRQDIASDISLGKQTPAPTKSFKQSAQSISGSIYGSLKATCSDQAAKSKRLIESIDVSSSIPGRFLKQALQTQRRSPKKGPQKKKAPKTQQALHSERVVEEVRDSLRNSSSASDINAYLEREFENIERSLFAPSYTRVLGSVVQATIKPVVLVGIGLAFFLLPGKSSLAVLSGPPQGGASTDLLATAFLEDHQAVSVGALSVSGVKKATKRIIEETIAPNDQVQLPLLREMGKPQERVIPVDQAAMKTVERDLSALTRLTPPKSAVNGDRRSLVKFISGLIAAFRPQLPDSSQIARHIVELSGSEQVDPLYVAAVIAIESRFSSTARSGVGATGLMQLMPMTAGEVAERYNLEGHAGKLTDPRANIRLGIRYLKELEQKYNGNRFLALSAYNWGPGNVDQAQSRERRIPGSVKKYSKTILERTNSWRKHFAHANESAELIAELPQQPTHS